MYRHMHAHRRQNPWHTKLCWPFSRTFAHASVGIKESETKSLSLHLSIIYTNIRLSFKIAGYSTPPPKSQSYTVQPISPSLSLCYTLPLSVHFLVLSTPQSTSCPRLPSLSSPPSDQHSYRPWPHVSDPINHLSLPHCFILAWHLPQHMTLPPQPYPALTPWLRGVECFPLAGLSRAAGLLCVGRPQHSLSHTHTAHTPLLFPFSTSSSFLLPATSQTRSPLLFLSIYLMLCPCFLPFSLSVLPCLSRSFPCHCLFLFLSFSLPVFPFCLWGNWEKNRGV